MRVMKGKGWVIQLVSALQYCMCIQVRTRVNGLHVGTEKLEHPTLASGTIEENNLTTLTQIPRCSCKKTKKKEGAI